MSLIKTRIVQIDLSQVVSELKRLNNNLEQMFQINAPMLEVGRDFDPDDYSSVMYSSEEAELITERLGHKIIGMDIK